MAIFRTDTFDTDASGWTAGTATTVARTTTTPDAGAGALLITKTLSAGTAVARGALVPVTAGQRVAFTVRYRPEVTMRAVYLSANFFDGASAYLSTSSGVQSAFVDQFSTPPLVLNAYATITFTVTAVSAGFVQLLVDGQGFAVNDRARLDTVQYDDVPATNAVPVANAGPDQGVTVGEVVTLTGSGTDSDGTIASYAWTLPTRPGGSAATLSGTGTTRTFTADVAGTYVGSLTVTDNGGATSPADTVSVVASAPAPSAGPHVRVGGVYVQAADPVVRVGGVYQ